MFRVETVEVSGLKKGDFYLSDFDGNEILIYRVTDIYPGEDGRLCICAEAKFDGIVASQCRPRLPTDKVRTVRLHEGTEIMLDIARNMLAEAGVV